MIYTGAISGQGPGPDVNNGPGSDLNSAHILPPSHHLLKSSSNNDPSPGKSNLESDGRYTCSSLIVSWLGPYLAKGPKHDFNNAPPPTSIHSSPTQIIAPPQTIPILCKTEYTSVLVSYSMVLKSGEHMNITLPKKSNQWGRL